MGRDFLTAMSWRFDAEGKQAIESRIAQTQSTQQNMRHGQL